MLALLKWNIKLFQLATLRERAYLSPKLEYASYYNLEPTFNRRQGENSTASSPICIKKLYTYDASVTLMLRELKWESLESCRHQFCLIML